MLKPLDHQIKLNNYYIYNSSRHVSELIYVFSFLFIILFSFSYLKFTYGLEIINEEKVYSPEIIKIQKYPKYPTTNSEIRIYVSVIDKFGQIVNSTLSYSFDKGKSYNHIPLELVNGTSSNGIYLGIIKPNSKNAENTILQYRLFFKDSLGYYHNSEYEQLKLKEPDLTSPVLWDDPKVSICPPEKIKNLESALILYANDMYGFNNNCFILYEKMPRPESPLLFYIGIMENNTEIKNATLFYSTDLHSTSEYMSKDLIIVRSPSQFNVYYAIGTFPSLYYDANLAYYIETYDFAGNKDTSKKYTIPFINSNPSPRKSIGDNETTANLEIKQIDNRNLEVKSTIDIEIGEDTIFTSSYDNLFEPRRPSIIVLNVNNTFDGLVNGFENKTFLDDDDNIYLDSSEGIVSTFYNATASGSLKLIGDPSLYPFDQYYVNLVIVIPVGNADCCEAVINDEIQWGLVKFDSQVKSAWDGINSEITTINNNNNAMAMHGLGSLSLCDNQMILDNDESTPRYCKLMKQNNDQSFLNVRIDLTRNYSISIIVIPLFSIFFLLGAIFIFENSLDNIGNRLTLTLGIFALLFTLPEIIDSMKPQTSGPTIADSMLSIIIIATIAFTISSIISSSSTIQKWFPKRHTWIDGIVFVIVSGFVIAYFNKYLLDSQLWWIVPTILFGLGYGLLLRALGIKINKPLIHFLRK